MGGAAAGARARRRSDRAGARGSGRRAARSAARWAHGGGTLLAPRHRLLPRLWASFISAGSSTRTSSRPISWWTARLARCGSPGFGIASRLSARAPGARAARDHRRYARLHGARANRADEPLDRFPQRSLRPRRHALPDAHGRSAVHGVRSDGVGALPYRQAAGAAQRAVERVSRRRSRRSS